jgi:hypothetical protein
MERKLDSPSMNTKNLLLSVFVVATVLLGSLTAIEYAQISSLNSQITSGNAASTSTTRTATGGIGCPHSLNDSYVISVSYGGAWGLTYQGYLGDSQSGQLVKWGNFYGHSPTNETITVAGTTAVGTTHLRGGPKTGRVEFDHLGSENSLSH